MPSPRIERVDLHSLNPAMDSILSTSHYRAQTADMILFMQSARARGMDVMQTRLVLRGEHLIYAVLPVILPGRTLLLICGSPARPASDDALMLLNEVIGQFASQDISMMQAMVDPQDGHLATLLLKAGFHRLAELVYLECNAAAQPWQLPAGYTIQTYSATNHADFSAAISASYEQTLDCPALHGVRDIEDVIIGHKAAGPFDANNWFLVRKGTAAAAVLLLSQSAVGDAMELVYIGLCKETRGQGLARALMKLASNRAAECGCLRLTTSVDAGNNPAMKLYCRAGMQRIGSRIAMVKVIHRHGDVSSTIHQQSGK